MQIYAQFVVKKWKILESIYLAQDGIGLDGVIIAKKTK